MSDKYGWFVVGFLAGLLFGIIFYHVKDMVSQFIEIYKLNQQLKKIS